jgi:hypothetical protein
MIKMKKCCANCRYCISIPRNNKYGDVDHLCIITDYYIGNINRDRNKIKMFTPGGRELECQYEQK